MRTLPRFRYKNILIKTVVISKNFEIDYLRDYFEKESISTGSKDCYLTVLLTQKFDLKKEFEKALNKLNMKTIIFNKITIYKNKKIVNRLIVTTKKTLEI